MLPVNQNLSIYKGDTFVYTFKLRTKTATGQPGAYVDLTGCTAKAQIRASQDDATVMAEFATATGGTTGSVTLTLSPTQTAALTSNGVWDAQITFADGTVKTYLAGTTTVVKEVTRV